MRKIQATVYVRYFVMLKFKIKILLCIIEAKISNPMATANVPILPGLKIGLLVCGLLGIADGIPNFPPNTQ